MNEAFGVGPRPPRLLYGTIDCSKSMKTRKLPLAVAAVTTAVAVATRAEVEAAKEAVAKEEAVMVAAA
eukprot:4365382-Pleurochrysis_carterae.AAC.1